MHNYIFIRNSQPMLGFFSIPKDGSDIDRFLKHEVGPSHMHCWKSMGIRGIFKQTRKIPR